jgi:hypothetical protein
MTLQDVIDAVQVQPWKYGKVWHYHPCPLSQEVLADVTGDSYVGPHIDDSGLRKLASERLGCSLEAIDLFTSWWANMKYRRADGLKLRQLGYRVPTYDEIQWEKP